MDGSEPTALGWTEQLRWLQADWLAIVGGRTPPADVDTWDLAMERLRSHEDGLRYSGQWISGFSDLLHIARVSDGELVHSNVVAWLLTPTARHGLGGALLRAILEAGWPSAPVPNTVRAVVEREVTREYRIADIVVTMGATRLVIENKVWSDESDRQCEDLFELWSDGVSDVRFLLLTLDGHPPRQTRTLAAADAWRSLSYGALVSWLDATVPTMPSTWARSSIEQYLMSLRHLVRVQLPFEIATGGGSVHD
jgi:hypothetical protein